MDESKVRLLLQCHAHSISLLTQLNEESIQFHIESGKKQFDLDQKTLSDMKFMRECHDEMLEANQAMQSRIHHLRHELNQQEAITLSTMQMLNQERAKNAKLRRQLKMKRRKK